jgi:NADH dehydrogenase
MSIQFPKSEYPRVVIIGCGFGGLQLAKSLNGAPFQVIMLDKNNYHTFQPLLYQVATSGLEADSIAYPIRKIFKGQKNFHFRWCEVKSLVASNNKIITKIGEVSYDYLVMATGTTTNFFGNSEFEHKAMPMKSVTEALNLRSLILQNFEKALLANTDEERQALMNFVVVGGGPTGVELAGALSELKNHVLPNDYPELDLKQMRVILVESGNELLQAFNQTNQQRSKTYLEELGAEVWLQKGVSKFDGRTIEFKDGEKLLSKNLIWGAGIKGVLIEGFDETVINSRKRLLVNDYCQINNQTNIFAIGDVACMVQPSYPNGHPQVAPVAIQMGELVAQNLIRQKEGKPLQTFSYNDKGSMATVGRNRAVVEAGKLHFGGWLGWLVWMSLHLMLLVGFRNRIVVFINWLWNYLSYDRNIRLIIRPYTPKEGNQ